MKHIYTYFNTQKTQSRQILSGISGQIQDRDDWMLHLITGAKALKQALNELPCDGLIGHFGLQEERDLILNANIPVVSVTSVMEHDPFPTMSNDNRAIGVMAAEHVIQCGFNRFWFLGYKEHMYVQLRERGFTETLEKHGFSCRRFQMVFNTASLSRFAKLIRENTQRLIIFACQDTVANQVLRKMLEHGLKAPVDYAILGVDNDLLESQLAPIPISSIEPDHQQMGRLATQYLEQLLLGKTAPNHTLVKPLSVVCRASTRLTDDDPILNAALTYIQENACKRMTIANMADEIGHSRSTIERRFKSRLNRKVLDYIKLIQMDTAKRELTHSNTPIYQLATQIGYADHRHFTREFKAHTGVTPSKYRAMHSGE